MKNSKYGSVRCYIKWQSTQIWSLEILGVIVTAQSSLQIQHPTVCHFQMSEMKIFSTRPWLVSLKIITSR
jgi:hypothetical protein